ncbi:MAG: MATE family efflux transporter [Pseudomonadota bacterium]
MNNPRSGRMHLLLEAPIFQMLWKLGAPNVIAVVILTSVTVADAWFVGQIGTVPLASLAIVFPFQTLMQMMAGGAIGGGVTSALARALGSGQSEHADAVAWHAVVIGVVMSIVFIAWLAFMPEPIFALLGGKGEVLDGAIRYAQIAFGGATATWLLYIFAAILRGTGDTATPATAIICTSILQIFVSGVLTLGLGPIPSFGIVGPAIAIVICQGLAALYMLVHLISSRSGIQLRVRALRWHPLADILKVGAVGLINSLTIPATVLTVTGIVGQYGTAALAGYGLGSRLELMLVPIVFGIGGVLTAAVGANIGAGQHARARRIAWTGAACAALVTGAIGATVAVAPQFWLGWFTTDPEAYTFGAIYLAIAAPFYGFFGGGQTLYFASQGTGRMILPVFVGVVRFAIVAAVGSLAVAMSWGITVVFAAVSAGLITIGVGLALCLFTSAWRPSPSPVATSP